MSSAVKGRSLHWSPGAVYDHGATLSALTTAPHTEPGLSPLYGVILPTPEHLPLSISVVSLRVTDLFTVERKREPENLWKRRPQKERQGEFTDNTQESRQVRQMQKRRRARCERLPAASFSGKGAVR